MKIYFRCRTDIDERPHNDYETQLLLREIIQDHFNLMKKVIQREFDKRRKSIEGSTFAVLLTYEKETIKETFLALKILKGQEEAAEKVLAELREEFKHEPPEPEDIKSNAN